jgi:hypothetical protein
MKSRQLSIEIAALCIAAFPIAALSQAGGDRLNAPTTDGSPTLQVTSDWLSQTLQVYGGKDDNEGADAFSNISIDNSCTLNFSITTSNLEGTGDYVVDTSSIRLGAVSSVQLNVNGGTPGLMIYTGQVAAVHVVNSPPMNAHGMKKDNIYYGETGNVQDVNSQFIEVMRTPQVIPGATIPPSPNQMIPRIIAALQHAVTLCAGSYTPPAQSNQPF